MTLPPSSQPPMQLNAGCPAGTSQPFSVLKPDGTSVLFALPAGKAFFVSDISIVPAQSASSQVWVSVGIRQATPTGHVQRWHFVGQVAHNVERNFTTPIEFSVAFEAWNSSAVPVVVNLYGYLGPK